MLGNTKVGLFRFIMMANDPLYLPEYKGGVLRGGFGTTFRRIACVHTQMRKLAMPDGGCGACSVVADCPYKAVFEPSPPPGSKRLRNLQDIPRPFVLRIPVDPRTLLAPGDHLEWEVALVGDAVKYLPYFVVTFKELGQTGFGLWHNGKRSRAVLEAVIAIDPFTGGTGLVYDGATRVMKGEEYPVISGEGLEARASRMRHDSVTVDFVSITRLKYRDDFVMIPEFHVLVRNLLRRLSTLSWFYQGREVDTDFRTLINKAEAVSSENLSIAWSDWKRYSGRSKNTMDFGGFTGRIRYRGNLSDYLPLLLFGSLVNVGKGTTFGLGQYLVEP